MREQGGVWMQQWCGQEQGGARRTAVEMACAEVADGAPTVKRRYVATHHQLSAPDSRSGNRENSGSGLDGGQVGRG